MPAISPPVPSKETVTVAVPEMVEQIGGSAGPHMGQIPWKQGIGGGPFCVHLCPEYGIA